MSHEEGVGMARADYAVRLDLGIEDLAYIRPRFDGRVDT
jgi:hypothetical protein